MKYLNSPDLYFNMGVFNMTPPITNVNYNFSVYDMKNNLIKSFSGQVFFFTNTQIVDYSFLLYSIPHEDSSIYTANGTVNITMTLPDYSKYSTQQVCMFTKDDSMSDYDVSTMIYPVTGLNMTKPSYYGCDDPVLAAGMHYNQVVWHNMNVPLQGQVITYDGSHTTTLLNHDCQFYSAYCPAGGNVKISMGTPPAYSDAQYVDYNYDTECHRYVLSWYDHRGFWQAQPFDGYESNQYQHNELTNLHMATRKYETQTTFGWVLKSDWVKHQTTYESLFSSQWIYLFDTQTYRSKKVLVTDTSWNENKSRSPFKFTVNIVSDTKQYEQ